MSVISANTCFGGIGDDGNRDKWDALTGFLRGRKPGVLLLQEMRGAGPAGTGAHLRDTAEALGMAVAAVGPPAPGAPAGAEHRTAVLVGPGVEVVPHDRPVMHPWDALPWAEALVLLPGADVPVWFYSVHLPPSSRTKQMIYAQKLAATVAARAAKGRRGFVAGDLNGLADAYGREQLAAMPLNVWPARVRKNPRNGSLRPRLGVHRELAAIGLADIAAMLPPGCRDPRDLTPTGTAGARVDRGYAHRDLARAVIRYWQVRLRDATDHDLIEFIISLALAREVLALGAAT
jgi:endonuclease/exonuclease/phosphatase family metal-dependent hydrolase